MYIPRKAACRAAPALAFACAILASATARAGEFSFGGKMFADVSVLQQRDRAAHTDSRAADADLKRLYLDADYAFDAAWSAHLTTDINWLRGKEHADLWVKHLYLQRKFAAGTVLRVGVDDMPMLALTSKWYGYRYIDPIGTSLQKIDSAADWGVHLKAPLAANVELAVSVVSGGGYKRPTHGRRADVEALLAWHPGKHTVLALGGYDGQLAADDRGPAQPVQHTARRLDVLAGYAGDTWRLGVRYAYASNWANLYQLQSERVRNWSAWGSVQIAPRWSVFARYDHSLPSRLLDPSRKAHYADAGLEWQPRRGLRLALAYKHNALERAGSLVRSSDEAGIWTEWTF
ncbi:MAG: porin [Rhodanobacter sp.]|jgi:hypothetical protein